MHILKLAPLTLLFLVFSCSDPVPSGTIPPAETPAATASPGHETGETSLWDTLSCEDLENHKVIYELLLHAGEHFMPGDEDTAHPLILRGHFTCTDSIQVLIGVPAVLNGSCGSCCSIILLMSCEEKPRLIWSGRSGEVWERSVRDLDHDGILDITVFCGSTWMGELSERFEIFNFENGKQQFLYESVSHYRMAEYTNLQDGDTLGTEYSDSLIDPDKDGIYAVYRVREISIYRGGLTEEAAFNRKEILSDTAIVPLKAD